MPDQASKQSPPRPILRNPRPCPNSRPRSRPVSPRGTRQSSPIPTNSGARRISDSSTQRNPSVAHGCPLFEPEPTGSRRRSSGSIGAMRHHSLSLDEEGRRGSVTPPHTRDLNPRRSGRKGLARVEGEADHVAEGPARSKISIPRKRSSNDSILPSTSNTTTESVSIQGEENGGRRRPNVEEKRKSLGRKLATTLERGKVVEAPGTTEDARKLKQTRLDSAVNLESSFNAEIPVSVWSRMSRAKEDLAIKERLKEQEEKEKEGLDREDATQATQGASIVEEGNKQLGAQVHMEIPACEVPIGKQGKNGVDFERQELARRSGESTYDSRHRLGRRNSSALTKAGEMTRSGRDVVTTPPPGSIKRACSTTGSYGGASTRGLTANTVQTTNDDTRRITGGQSDGTGDGTGDGRLSHAALRLPSHTAATKFQALLSEGPLPRRRKSSTRSLRAHMSNGKQDKSAETQSESGTPVPSHLSGEQLGDDKASNATESEDEGNDEWDEESLLQLTDWWRQVLAAGATPSPKEIAMMDSFLAEFMKEDMPKLDMVLRTRLHRLLVAIIDGAEAHREWEEEDVERFHELERKASLLERRWMKATRGRLFRMERERRGIMFGKSGSLAMVQPYSGVMEGPRWVTERNERAGMADAEPGAWWLNTTCAYRDGMIGNTQGYVSNFKQHAHPTLVLEVGEEFPTSFIHTTRYVNEGTIYYMLLPLLSTLDKPIRILRNWTLKSKLAPPAGLRYDGWYDVLSYGFKRVSEEGDTFRIEVLMRRCKRQMEMEKVLMVPTPSMLDEWEEYLAIRDDEMRREKSVAEYEGWHRREREGEFEREMWLCERVEEEAGGLESGGVVRAWEGS